MTSGVNQITRIILEADFLKTTINAVEMKSRDEEIRERTSKDDNDATEKSFCTHHTCVQVPA